MAPHTMAATEMRRMRYFLAVADRKNFTRAAESLHVSQPSLSIQIAALERELGTPLFDRLGKQVALTQAGELLLDYAQRALGELEQGIRAVQDLKGAKRGRLVVGTLSTVNTYLIPPLVCKFKQRFPMVHLHVQAQPSAQIAADVLAHRFDFGICHLPMPAERLNAIPLFDETLSLVAPRRLRLPHTRMRMRELADLPLILMPADYCLRKMIESECTKAGVQPRVSVEMTSPEGILEAVKAGAGVTILPELYVRSRLSDGDLTVVKLVDPAPRYRVGLVSLLGRYQDLVASEFIHLCRATLDELRLGERLPAFS